MAPATEPASRTQRANRAPKVTARALVQPGGNAIASTASAAHATTKLKAWEFDPTGYVIRVMKATRLAWNVIEITPERQREKLA